MLKWVVSYLSKRHNFYGSLSIFQAIFAFIFESILVIHAFELLYAGYKCIKLGLTSGTTLKWLLSVAFNGIYATKMLYNPEKFLKSKIQ